MRTGFAVQERLHSFGLFGLNDDES